MSRDFNFDAPRKKAITDFLRYLYYLKDSNPDLILNEAVVYNELGRSGLKTEDMENGRELSNIRQYFPVWAARFGGDSNVKAFCSPARPSFFQFVSGNLDSESEFIKINVPLDKKHLFQGVNLIFDYLSKSGIEHCSLVNEEVKSDNVVIRLRKSDYANAMKIINYITSNDYLKAGLNKNNPFMPTVSNIGVMRESGISYNLEMSRLISNYINVNCNKGVQNITADNFNQWLDRKSYNKEVNNIFKNAIDEEPRKLSRAQKISLLLDGLNATYEKYGLAQAYVALLNGANGEYKYFTNGSGNTRYRDLMKQILDGETVRLFVYSALEQINGKTPNDVELGDAVKDFCSFMFENDISLNFNEACMTTMEKHDLSQAYYAINLLMNKGDSNGFTRYRIVDGKPDTSLNYRDLISFMDKEKVMNTIKGTLKLRGVSIDGIPDDFLIDIYLNELRKGKYDEDEKSSEYVK